MHGYKRMRIELSDSWHGYSSEAVWVEQTEDGEYRIMNSPFYAFDLSFRDVVIAKDGDDGMLVLSAVSARGGHSTYRLMLHVDPKSQEFARYWRPLQESGCSFEGIKGKLLAVDIPPETDIYKVYELLESGEGGRAWEFEEAHCGHQLRC